MFCISDNFKNTKSAYKYGKIKMPKRFKIGIILNAGNINNISGGDLHVMILAGEISKKYDVTVILPEQTQEQETKPEEVSKEEEQKEPEEEVDLDD